MSRRLGLIVGANQYQDPTFRPLQFAENDARAIAQWLVNNKGGQWKPGEVQHLQGPHVTKQLVESLISQMCLQLAEPGDLVLIYFAGHVFLDETSGDGYLALSDTRYHMASTGVSLTSLAQHVLPRSRASHILVILDAFQTGRAWTTANRSTPYDSKPLLGPALFNLIQQQPNRQFLCSCRGNDRSPEAGEQGLGLFMHRTIINLSGPARDSNGNISLRQLHGQLFGTLGEQQRPQLFGRDQPPLTLVGELPPSTGMLQHVPPTGPDGALRTHSGQLPSTENFRISTATLQGRKADTGKQQAMVDQHRQQQCQRMLEQANELLQREQIQPAYSLVDQVLQMSPQLPPALTLKAQILGTTGNHQEALATIEQLIQVDPNNAIAWSMKAVVLSNIGQYQAALVAIERSLELDVSNLETHGIKNNIMANLATEQTRERISSQLLPSLDETRSSARTFFIALGLQVLGFIVGVIGAIQPILLTGMSDVVGIVLMSLGLLVLTANAARSAHRYGLSHLVPTCLMSVIAVVTLVSTYLVGYTKIVNFLADPQHPEQSLLLGSIIFLGIWLITAAAMPFIAALSGLISGSIARARSRTA